MCKRLCTGGIPLPKHPFQHLLHLGKTLQPPLRPPPFLPLRLQVQKLVHRLSLGKLVVPHLRPTPHFPNKPLHQVSAAKIGPEHLGVTVKAKQGPRVLPPGRHQGRVPGTPGLPQPLQSTQGFLSAPRHVHPLQVLGQKSPVPGTHLPQARAHHVHHAPLPPRHGINPPDGLLYPR
jgi:hypothetical protein